MNVRILGGMVVGLWTLELIDSLLLRGKLNRFGIRPRQSYGIKGIFLSPLLHGDLKHLAANTLPLVMLGGFILFRNQQTFAIVTAVVWLISGIGTWLFGGPRTNHIGASGIVFGYLGFLLLQGYLERSPIAIGLAVISGVLYGGSLWGVLPIKRGRSWQGHLFGLIGGGIAARYLPELNQYATIALEKLQLMQTVN
ncbi:rhomboid family intramembrane serine protease [filamentous cyanobacterium LEGE 11480]|uniref:Rhomboid family intramembrane serine protease n=2 Tax=Romeriopsis TaxID=2992131 RepID=A0A928Z6R9_9CYAN|nr:rhomboid family intramembrane serine protease [Romeriopsis navalis LEGE 11480]